MKYRHKFTLKLDANDGIDGNLHTLDPTKPRPQATCPKCGTTDDAFYMKNHKCEY